jgi:cytochrome c oxidase assembly protein subunit 15
MNPNSRFSKWTRLLLFYTILVILWGAWVRISHSGDGCGDTWPLCHGQIIPADQQKKTWVELSHRLMSGLFGFFVLGLWFAARKNFPKGHAVRKWALFSLIFTITEALLGAKLVLFRLVADNDTPYRAFVMSLHFLNSLMLSGSLALTLDFSLHPQWLKRQNSPWNLPSLKPNKLVFGVILAFFLIGITGAIAALSGTLFPSSSLLEGLQADWDANAHYLIRLRGLHPLFGLLLGGSLALVAWISIQLLKPNEMALQKRSRWLALIVAAGVSFGVLTLLFLAPVWMKLVHLALAHSIWILLLFWIRAIRYRESEISSPLEIRPETN